VITTGISLSLGHSSRGTEEELIEIKATKRSPRHRHISVEGEVSFFYFWFKCLTAVGISSYQLRGIAK
jgi:hypothetical protein